jgi:hypothetical protein
MEAKALSSIFFCPGKAVATLKPLYIFCVVQTCCCSSRKTKTLQSLEQFKHNPEKTILKTRVPKTLDSVFKTASTAQKRNFFKKSKPTLKDKKEEDGDPNKAEGPEDQISHPTNFLSTSNTAQGSSCCRSC